MTIHFDATGGEQIYTVRTGGTFQITARGAEGSKGNTYSGDYGSVPGKGAVLSATFELAAGDVLHIAVGMAGTKIEGAARDGASGGGGGGSFIFREIPAITDSRYQFSKGGKYYEALLVAAGGGGTHDESYRGSRGDGYDGNGAAPYTPTNYAAWSTSTNAGTSSSSISSVLGISQYISYNLIGAYYLRGTSRGQGGYGGGSATDDNRSYGGGWTGRNYTAYSWSAGADTSGENGANSGNGSVDIEILHLSFDFITDRTKADVDALRALLAIPWDNFTPEQKAAWSSSKGAYNASDLNRVGVACAYLFDLFDGYGYPVPGYTALREDWDDDDGEIPTETEMATYLSTVAALKAVLQAAQEIPSSMSRLTVEGANNIEKLLIEVEDQLRRMAQSFIYSGMTYSGVIWSQIGG